MDNPSHAVDWALIRCLLAVADTGSLSGAARQLGQSQPTLGRQIRAAEHAFGAALFDRHPRGLTPTALAQSLLPAARRMETAARSMALIAAGQTQDQGGTVRVTASRFVSVYLLPPILSRLRAAMSDISLELVPSDTTENLLFHEADIAIRMYRPTQLDMITQHIGDLPLGLFATDGYIARRGLPRDMGDLMHHDIIGYDRDEQMVKGFRAAGLDVTRDSFAIRTDDQIAYWELVRAGAGIGVGQGAVARRDPHLRAVLPGAPLPVLPVWLTAHDRLRHVPRVDRVWQALRAGLLPSLV
jgi:DNA-binding transcriptional LysR family regulator